MFAIGAISIYFISILTAISAMTLVVLLTNNTEVGRRRQLLYLEAFAVSNLLIATLYLCMTIQDTIAQYHHYPVLLRALDISLYIAQAYTWCKYLLVFGKDDGENRRAQQLCNLIYGILLVIGVFAYVLWVDDDFLFINTAGHACESLISGVVSLFLLAALLRCVKGVSGTFLRGILILLTLLLIVIQWSTTILMLVETKFEISFMIHEYTIEAVLQMLVIFTLALGVYRVDYSSKSLEQHIKAMVKTEIDEESEELPLKTDAVLGDTDTKRLADPELEAKGTEAGIEKLFDEKELTKREREIARLAYAGLTNPEIAEHLCISQYTVKRHMHSIFEKMNISARIELVHMMNGM